MTRGMDSRRNTSSAEAKLLSLEGGTDVFSDVSSSGVSDGFSVIAGFVTGTSVISVETDDVVVSGSTRPKDPSKISSSEELSMPVRVILILPKTFSSELCGFSFLNGKLVLANVNPEKYISQQDLVSERLK